MNEPRGTEDFSVYVSATGEDDSWVLVADGTLPDILGQDCEYQPEPTVIDFEPQVRTLTYVHYLFISSGIKVPSLHEQGI